MKNSGAQKVFARNYLIQMGGAAAHTETGCDRIAILEMGLVGGKVVFVHVEENAPGVSRIPFPDVGREMVSLKEVEQTFAQLQPQLARLPDRDHILHDRENQICFSCRERRQHDLPPWPSW